MRYLLHRALYMYRHPTWSILGAIVLLGASTSCHRAPGSTPLGPCMEPLGIPGGLAPAQLPAIRPPAAPPGTAALVGVVTDAPSGLGVQGAQIHVIPLDGREPGRGTFSDSAGGFRVDALVPGTYQVRGRRIVTHRAGVDTVRLGAGVADTIRLSLARYDSVAFDCEVIDHRRRRAR